jgi:tetratricopeptide (TPR) repeat protein
VVEWNRQPEQPIRIERTRTTPSVPTAVEQGYAAYTRGDWATARSHYQRQLASDPLQRDALLGLAAVARQQGQVEEARALYTRLLQRDPSDPLAIAGLAALDAERDQRAAEIRLRTLADRTPDTAEALAQLLARQGRWSEAQPYFFQAYHARPEDADAAYNLAVALDHLNQPRLAADYYEKALQLAQPGHRFDRDRARQRVETLRAP